MNNIKRINSGDLGWYAVLIEKNGTYNPAKDGSDTVPMLLRRAANELDWYKTKYKEMNHEVQQNLGKALCYPWYKDNQHVFPGTTEANGVVVDEDAIGMSLIAAERIKKLNVVWHDVTKELPDVEEHVIIYCENGNTSIDWIEKDTGQFLNNFMKSVAERALTAQNWESVWSKNAKHALNNGAYITHWRNIVPGIDTP